MSWHWSVLGVPTNLSFLRALIRHPAFRSGDLSTHFLQEHTVDASAPTPALEVLAAAALSLRSGSGQRPREEHPAAGVRPSPWLDAGAWRQR